MTKVYIKVQDGSFEDLAEIEKNEDNLKVVQTMKGAIIFIATQYDIKEQMLFNMFANVVYKVVDEDRVLIFSFKPSEIEESKLLVLNELKRLYPKLVDVLKGDD
ncbi:MAG: hypothetical protein PHW22_04580 [Bacilli bacterium]|nr:hypothetical protein [Bacilli bacterium]